MLSVIIHHMLKFWKAKICREVLGNPVTTMFLYLTLMYVYLVVLIQHVLQAITIMAVWQFVHLGTRMHGYVLLVFKNICLDISRKKQKQYDTNKNHVNFIIVPFLACINQFLCFQFQYLEEWSPAKNCSCKNFKIWSSVKVYVLKIYEQWSMQVFCALVELQIVFLAKVSTSNVHHKLRNTHISYYIT